jgi:hypothetical protein
MKRAGIAAARRGSTLRDPVAEAAGGPGSPQRRRMNDAPIKLPRGHTISGRSNADIAQLFEQEDVAPLNDVYRGR